MVFSPPPFSLIHSASTGLVSDSRRKCVVVDLPTYNRRRRQRGLGKLTPVEFELAFAAQEALAV
jgi:hypothetical protein